MRHIRPRLGHRRYRPQQLWGIKNKRHGYGHRTEIILPLSILTPSSLSGGGEGVVWSIVADNWACRTGRTIRSRLGDAASTTIPPVVFPPALEQSIFPCSLHLFASFHSIITSPALSPINAVEQYSFFLSNDAKDLLHAHLRSFYSRVFSTPC